MARERERPEERFRPSSSPKGVGKERGQRVASVRNALLSRLGGRVRSAAGTTRPSASSRRVAIQISYTKMGNDSRALAASQAHLRYISRDDNELFGRDAEAVTDRAAFGAALPGEEHQFRFMVSPEDGTELDMKAFTRNFMKSVEGQTASRLRWVAAVHHDTGRPHAHIVIRGVDESGQPVRFDREFISVGARQRASELVARELGPRTNAEITRQHEREVTSERLTELDRVLATLCEGTKLRLHPDGHRGIDRNLLVARLRHLEKMGLCDGHGSNWQMSADWQGVLKSLGQRGDIVARMHKELHGDVNRYDIGGDVQLGAGQLLRKGEAGKNVFLLVAKPDGRISYAEVSERAALHLHEGAIVRLARPDGKASGVRALILSELTPKQQVSYRGPTWLDSLDVGALPSHGFGLELQRCKEQRNEFLQRSQVTPAQLPEAERHAVLRTLADSLRLQPVATLPDDREVKVSLRENHRTPGGNTYAVVTDARSNIMVVPWRREFAEHDTFVLRQTRDQGLVVQGVARTDKEHER